MKNKIILCLAIPIILLSQNVEEVRGVKITNVDSEVLSSKSSIADAMDYLASINVNTILTVVWNGSGHNGAYTLYPSAVMDSLFGFEKGPTGSVEDPLQRIIIEAHRNGIEVLPWFEYGFATSYSQDGGHILEKYPHWALKNKEGNLVTKNGFDWMSAVNPEVQDFIKALTMEVCENYDIDGVEYSDRIPAMPVEGGYDSVTVSIYKQEHNGEAPPDNYEDSDWKCWRADKLSDWYREVSNAVKEYDPNLHVSSSPSIYPWSYHEYLQDSYTWVNSGICDDIIPQLYRYDYSSYQELLNSSLNNFPGKEDIYIAGILMNIGDYIISPEYLLDAMQLNRDKGIIGEAFFFYEGLRKNNDQLGDTLRKTFYRREAMLPHRNGNLWRPKATIVNEDDEGAEIKGNWEKLKNKDYGFEPNILISKESEYAAVEYSFYVPFEAWFDVYAYVVRSPKATKSAPYTIYHANDSSVVTLDQTAFNNTGWQKLKTVYLEEGGQKLVKLDNSGVAEGDWVIADAVMAMINRKKSPDVFIDPQDFTEIDRNNSIAREHTLRQNYPNPFNASTTVEYKIAERGAVEILIYNLQGQLVKSLVNRIKPAGHYRQKIQLDDLSSGVYFYRLKVNDKLSNCRKMIFLK